ncbi:MAG: Mrp/NBP35 family ATP-binding protein [Candidatus Brocadiia bacterium]
MNNNGTNDARQQQREQQQRLEGRMALVDNIFVVMSGKGGVGKSTVAVNLAAELQRRGHSTGLLDSDMHGPSTPTMLSMQGSEVFSTGNALQPPEHESGLSVMSIGFLTEGENDAVIWRGPMKMNVLRQILADVEWGELDYLVIDLPPGTGDEPLSLCQMLPHITGAIVVTTPQQVALSDVRRCINFCRELDLEVTGMVENMSGFICPHCGENSNIFGRGGGRELARQMDIPFLGDAPLDPRMVGATDRGEPYLEKYPDSALAERFSEMARNIEQSL